MFTMVLICSIELAILSAYYGVEIDSIDVQTGRIDKFGEYSQVSKWPLSLFLLYILRRRKISRARTGCLQRHP